MIVKNKEFKLKNVFVYATYLLIVWGLYRFIFKLPEEVEELVIKPVVWLLPLLYVIRKEKEKLSSLGVSITTLFPSLYFVIGLGAIFAIEALLLNFFKYGYLNLGSYIGDKTLLLSIGISLATAFSEEIAFRGYIFNRLNKILKNEWSASIITTIFWVLIHVPIVVFIMKWDLLSSISYLFITALFGLGSNFVFARTGNVFASVILHVVWEWPIILFR
jgi:membrane protease YdiL (CAAX protease family)